MPRQKPSNAGDLTSLAREIEAVFQRHLGQKPALAIAFQMSTSDEVHWVTNVSRADGIKIMATTAVKMQAQTN